MGASKASESKGWPRKGLLDLRPAPLKRSTQTRRLFQSSRPGRINTWEGRRVPGSENAVHRARSQISAHSVASTSTLQSSSFDDYAASLRPGRAKTVVGTPTSSTVSGETTHTTVTTDRVQGAQAPFTTNRYVRDDPGSSSIDPNTERVSESLLGLEDDANHAANLQPIHGAQPVSERGPSPPNRVQLPQNPEPWSQYQLRQPNSPRLARNGGRQGPLLPEARDHASRMRTVGVCIRCSINRDKCDKFDDNVAACTKCRRRMRKWVWGCTKSGIGSRWDYVLPRILTIHLENINEFINNNLVQDSHNPPFTVRMSLWLGEPLLIEVREFEPVGRRLLEKGVIRMQNTEGAVRATLVRLECPPIIPHLPDREASRLQIREQIRSWLYAVAHDKDADWANLYFPRPHERWQRDVLGIICGYYHANHPEKAFQVLNRGLEISFLTYLMIHTLTVPEEFVPNLYDHIQSKEFHGKTPTEQVCPTVVNRWIKCVILPLMHRVGKEFLSMLQSILHAKGHSPLAREITFCATFLCLIVLSKHQIAVQQLLIITENPPLTIDEAAKQIREMEHEVTDFLIYICQHKAKECQKTLKRGRSPQNAAEVRAAQYRLFDQIREVTDDARQSGDYSQGSQNLTTIDPDSFITTNDSRILTKFYEAMAPYIV